MVKVLSNQPPTAEIIKNPIKNKSNKELAVRSKYGVISNGFNGFTYPNVKRQMKEYVKMHALNLKPNKKTNKNGFN